MTGGVLFRGDGCQIHLLDNRNRYLVKFGADVANEFHGLPGSMRTQRVLEQAILAGSQGYIRVSDTLGIADNRNDNIGAGLLNSKGGGVDHGLDAGAAVSLLGNERLQTVRVKYRKLRFKSITVDISHLSSNHESWVVETDRRSTSGNLFAEAPLLQLRAAHGPFSLAISNLD